MLWSITTYGQSSSDTTFYNSQWNITTRDSCSYYRLIKKQNESFRVRDYYNNDTVKMQGIFTSLRPEIKNGFFIYYFKSGHKRMEGDYYYNKRRGVFKTYDDSTGIVLIDAEYKDDMRNGRYIEHDIGRIKTTKSIYKSDSLIQKEVDFTFPLSDSIKGGNSKKGITSADDNKAFKEILEYKFEYLKSRDSFLYVPTVITMKFKIDSNGRPLNIKHLQGGNSTQQDIVRKSIREMGVWHPIVARQNDPLNTTLTVSVWFPQMTSVINSSFVYMATDSTAIGFKPKSDSLQAFMRLHYKGTTMASDPEMSGGISVAFTVNQKGKIADVLNISGSMMDLRSWVVRMIYKFGSWQPIIVDGHPESSGSA